MKIAQRPFATASIAEGRRMDSVQPRLVVITGPVVPNLNRPVYSVTMANGQIATNAEAFDDGLPWTPSLWQAWPPQAAPSPIAAGAKDDEAALS
jgi:hypothetical protein